MKNHEGHDVKIYVLPGHEKYFKKAGIAYDAQYLDYDSLCRVYGKGNVDKYLRDSFLKK